MEMGLEPGGEVEASALTASGTAPEAGVTVSAAVGALDTVTAAVAVAVAPELSLTVPTMDPKVDCARSCDGDRKKASRSQDRAKAVCLPPLFFEDCCSDSAKCLKNRRACDI